MPSNKKLLQAAAGNAGESLYVEDVFSTYLYDGTGASLPIVNGIDLDAEGGLVWTKSRTSAAEHKWYDSARGISFAIESNTADANQTEPTGITSFNSNGYTYGTDGNTNSNGTIYASWTFRKAEKFFDIVTYTGNGSSGYRQIAHNLGSTPAAVIQKNTTDVANWYVYHKDTAQPSDTDYATHGAYLNLNNTNAKGFSNGAFPKVGTSSGGVTAVYDSSVFTIGEDLNESGKNYVLYLFASDAGGFGDDDENIIKCGIYTGTNATVNDIDCGFEPQWIMIKGTDRACNWIMVDVMRGATVAPSTSFLEANTSDAEATSTSGFALVHPTATGFSIPSGVSGQVNEFNEDYIYIAIRRPMKTPEAGTEVFAVDDRAAATPAFVSDFPVDLYWTRAKTGGNFFDYARLRGDNYLQHDGSNAETSGGAYFDSNTGVFSSGSASTNNLAWMFKRATGFFDVVAYTGDGTAGSTQAHNLGVVPEFMVVKPRGSGNWATYNKFNTATDLMYFNENYATDTNSSIWNNTTPTDTVFTLGSGFTNTSNGTFIAYLFATLAGVSKVGSYTGTGADLNVDCGFSAGARFILVKRTDSTGDWYVYDYFRGIVSGNDPYLLLNTGTGEVTNTDYIDPLNAGFTVTSSAPAALNASGGTYIFLAIA